MSLNTTTTAEFHTLCHVRTSLPDVIVVPDNMAHTCHRSPVFLQSSETARALQVVVKWVGLPLSSLLHFLTKILKLCCLQPTLLLIPSYYRFSSLYMLSYILIYSHAKSKEQISPGDLTKVDSKSLFPQITKLIESYFKMNSLINDFYQLLIQLQLKQDEERINWFN